MFCQVPLPPTKHRVPHFCSLHWAPFRGCWKSVATSTHDLILVEVDSRCQWQVPICNWQQLTITLQNSLILNNWIFNFKVRWLQATHIGLHLLGVFIGIALFFFYKFVHLIYFKIYWHKSVHNILMVSFKFLHHI